MNEAEQRAEKARLVTLRFYRSRDGYGWSVTMLVRGRHRVRWNSTRATTPMLWRFIYGGDEDCNRATTLTMWPLGMLDVWWEPKWRPTGSGMCEKCLAEYAADLSTLPAKRTPEEA